MCGEKPANAGRRPSRRSVMRFSTNVNYEPELSDMANGGDAPLNRQELPTPNSELPEID